MFNFFSKAEDEKYLVSPLTGRALSIRAIPDEVFSEKILGDGVAIIPSKDEIVSPVNGKIVQIADTHHAFCILSEEGVEILIHVGVDTIGLKGKGFESFVQVGQKVKAGELIGKADIQFIEDNDYPTHTAVLIVNMSQIKDVHLLTGVVEAGKTPIISFKK